MAWQSEVGGSADQALGYRDGLTNLVNMATSKHVATVAVNNGGTATYVVGDIMTLTDASAHFDARFEVTSVAIGVIDGLRIVASGAFALQAASAVVGGAAGTGYVVGDILEVQGGSSRCPAKFKVATLSGSAVATVTLFEGGGAYSSTPANDAATVGVGPAAFAGDDACTLTVTYQALITPLTAVPITGGSGAGSPTVDITLADTGWSVDSRNRNDWQQNSLTDEKAVTLIGDATGRTNKPYLHFTTGSNTPSLDDFYFIAWDMSVAHNSALDIYQQAGITGKTHTTAANTLASTGSYLPFPKNASGVGATDWWMSVDDISIRFQVNINPTATTDSGIYFLGYSGYEDTLATEAEDPYPAFVFASASNRTKDPTIQHSDFTSIAEQRTPNTVGPGYYYRSEDATWYKLENDDTSGGVGVEGEILWPFGEIRRATSGSGEIVAEGPLQMNNGIIQRDGSTATVILQMVPGTAAEHMLYPIVHIRRLTTLPTSADRIRGSIRGIFWLYNSDSSGSPITDFSEDYITVGGDRYYIFHSQTRTERYMFYAIKETV